MPKLTVRQPRYCRHKDRAVVYVGGRAIYLGPYGSPESKRLYRKVMTEHFGDGIQRLIPAELPDDPPEAVKPKPAPAALSVVELIRQYRRYALTYYVKNGRPTSEVHGINCATRFLRRKFGRLAADEFSPTKLQAVRDAMITAKLARTTINQNVNRIRRMFRWAAANELVPGSVVHDLDAVDGLKAGRSKAKEMDPVRPVEAEVVDATLPYLPPIVADMVRVQQLTAMRPQEVCMLRPKDLDRSGDVWHFTPPSHKTQHHSKTRIVSIGPRCQEVLRRYLLRPDDAYCFAPKDSEKARRRELHEARKTPPSYGNRPGTNRKRKPKRRPGERYTTGSYRRAITRAVELANKARAKAGESPLPCWSPNQLRHSAATLIRSRFSVDAASVVLGHSNPDTTLIYAAKNMQQADAIMREIG